MPILTTVSLPGRLRTTALLLSLTLLGACQISPQGNSPDVKYSSKSSAAVKLQVPPDLTDVTRGEQFVLPGDTGAAIARNTLLPGFDTVSYQRNATQGWLVSKATPEDLWPRLQAFLRSEGYSISRTQPLNGIIETQWRERNGDSSTLANLINSARDAAQRVSLRLERTDGGGSRVFGRVQVFGDDDSLSDSAVWGVAANNPEKTNVLLQQLMVFLGIEEQRAKGILDDARAQNLTSPVTLQTTTGGASLILHYGFVPSYSAIQFATRQLGMTLKSQDEGSGILRLTDSKNVAGLGEKGSAVTVQLNPQHVSAVVVSVADGDGRRFDDKTERKLLLALRDQLS